MRCIREGKNLVKDTKEDTDSHIIADAPGTLLLLLSSLFFCWYVSIFKQILIPRLLTAAVIRIIPFGLII